MKQILFSAISKEPESTGQTIYGSIVNLSKPDKKPFYKIRDADGKYSYIEQESIKQFTGKFDQNNVPIFDYP